MATSSISSNSQLSSLISQLMLIERQPIAKLEARKSDLNVLDAIYKDLKSKLKALKTAAEGMTDPLGSTLDKRKVTTSDAGVVTATATTSAPVGSHSLFVTQLAKHHTMVSNQFTSAGTSLRTALGEGDQVFSVTVNGVETQVTVTIDAEDTDEDIVAATAAAINAVMAEVENEVAASAINDTASTSKLVLRSGATGSDYRMTLNDVTGSLLSALGIDNEAVAATETTGGYVHADDALDAKFVLDGIAITRGTNVISDVLKGVTLTLKSHHGAGEKAVELAVSRDTSAIKQNIEDFLQKYNDVLFYVRAKTKVDSSGVRQPLSNEFIYRTLAGNLRAVMTASVATSAPSIKTLYDVGIEPDDNGELSVNDAAKLDDALSDSPAAVAALFKGSGGFAGQIEEILKPFVAAAGHLDTSSKNVSAKVSGIDETVKRLEERMSRKEAAYLKQYSQLQQMMARLSQQSSYISALSRQMSGYGYY